MALRFYNSLSRQKEIFKPIKSNKVSLYTCGPTVYDEAHIGNFRTFIFEDLLKRYLLFRGYDVCHVMNITDVDDKTINRAREEHKPLDVITRKYSDQFFKDVEWLKIIPANVYPKATEHIPGMIRMIKKLLAKGFAYKEDDGSVYFNIRSYPDYGRLVQIELSAQKVSERMVNDEYEKDEPQDFALWKSKKEEDGDVFWDAPWGPGRPGWHIECSAMSSKLLGSNIDIHGGGIDLLFPHHENEIAQSESRFKTSFSNFWVHNNLINFDNQKMSKSLGNIIKARDFITDYKNQLSEKGPSFTIHGMKKEQYDKIGDFTIFDRTTNSVQPLTREDIGEFLKKKKIDPVLDWDGTIKDSDGNEIEICTIFWAYKHIHLKDYDLESVVEITHSNKELIQQLAKYLDTIKPAAIHIGEGLNHWFHAVENNRACYLPVILTGNIGKRGAGCHTWAGNYKAGLFQGSKEAGPGFKGWVAEDPFAPNLNPKAKAKELNIKGYARGEEPSYWNVGDFPLLVDTPKFGKKSFTGETHMPTPTKAVWHNNVNLLNNAKYHYEMVKNTNPKVEMWISQDIEMTATCEYADIVLPANSWAEQQNYELTGSCSNPFLQIWNGGLKPVFDSKDDVLIWASVAKQLGKILKDKRFEDYWKFVLEGKTEIYIDRLLDGSNTTKGYTTKDIMDGKYGEPGSALMLFRTYPRIPFYEQIKDSAPFYTPTGRMQAYNDEPEIIEYGENFIVHREGPEATPYLPNVIVSNNPLIRPEDYGIPADATSAEERQARNLKLPWQKVKKTKNFLWEDGFSFYCLTPKSRHTTHSSWAVTDWHFIWSNPFGDPYRKDKRQPGVGEHTMYMNSDAAKDLGIEDGDYVYVDSDPQNRPYRNFDVKDPFYKVARLKVRCRYNPSYPYHVIMIKHGAWMATEKSVLAHESRADGRAQSKDTGYQASYRYGSHQSLTYGWQMPMQQLDSLFHKAKAKMGFLFGYEADNHAINTAPKETLVKITFAEKGGLKGKGKLEVVKTGFTPANENEFMENYIAGNLTTIEGDEWDEW